MIAVCDMGPLHYLVLVGCDHILPRIFDRVITARVVIEDMKQRDLERKQFRARSATDPSHDCRRT